MKSKINNRVLSCRRFSQTIALSLVVGMAAASAHAQTAPTFGAGTAGGAAADGEEKTFRILTVKHVYVGGIAGMFKGTGIIPTAPFVSPGFANGGGMGGGMMGGMGGFGGGMGGGMMGGFGGGMGGFGGGGFGGGMGGFGGGGFGGGMGGIGGGGFGGGGFGF